jgi:hypothetical protein
MHYRAGQTMVEDQVTWIKDATDRVTKILRDTPPDGEQFTQAVKVGGSGIVIVIACNYKTMLQPMVCLNDIIVSNALHTAFKKHCLSSLFPIM